MAEFERERRVTEYESDDPQRTVPIDPVDRPVRGRRRVVEHEVVDDVGPDRVAYVDPPVRSERRVVEHESYVDPYRRRQIVFSKISNVVWSLIGFIEALIALRVVLKLVGANAGNGFVDFVYRVSGLFVNPFLGIVSDPSSGNSVLEINSLIAMLVYLLVGWGIVRLVWLLFDVTEPADA